MKSVAIAYFICIVACIYTCMGMYGISLNYKKRINQIFFLMSVCLSIWSIYLVLSINARNAQDALLFNQVTVIGYGFLYGLSLHLSKILSSNSEKVSKKFLILTYLPSFYFLFSFLLLRDVAAKHTHMVYTEYGWASVESLTFSNIIYNIYVPVYIVLSIKNLLHWHKNLKNKIFDVFFKITIGVIIVSFLMRNISNVYTMAIFKIPNINYSVVFILPAMIMIFYMLLKSEEISVRDSFIISDDIDERSKTSIFRILGFFYIIMAYTSIAFDYFTVGHYKSNVIFIVVICFIAAIIHMFLTEIFKKDSQRLVFIVFLALLGNFVIYIRYYESMAVTIWALFFCYLAISSIFTNSIGSYIIYISSIVFQFVLWYKIPYVIIKLEWTDYVVRIILLTAVFALIFFINVVYRRNNLKNIKYIETQGIMNEFSEMMIEVGMDTTDEMFLSILEHLREGFKCKRVYSIIFLENENIKIENVYYVDSDSKTIEYDYKKTIFNDNLSCIDKLVNGQSIKIYDVNDYDIENCSVDIIFESRNINGLCIFPVFVKGEIRAIIGFEFIVNETNKILYLYENMLINLIGETIDKFDNEKKLFIKANYDYVTGLININYFSSEVDKILKENSYQEAYVLYIDIDNFKMVNDIFGNDVGDDVLKSVANQLTDMGDDTNFITRYGNDDFIVFCNSYKRDKIKEYVEEIIFHFKNGFDLDDKKIRLNMCIGISEYKKDGEDIATLIKNADIAMGHAKKTKYFRYHFYDNLDKEKLLKEAALTEKLFNAIDNNEFSLVFQPQIGLKNNEVIGAEALLRWNSKDFGLVPPSKFISILEHTGFIIEVGEWIIEEAIKEQVSMREKGMNQIRMSINLSPIQILDTKLVDKIQNIMEKYNANPKYIEFEITESATIDDDNFISELFEKAKDMGVSIAIDDFGTGFSSLNRLQLLPLDRLKIDKSFVDGIGVDSKKERVVGVVIELAKSLGLKSIAEGVEKKEQLNYLIDNGCDEIQGYYFAKPMYKEEFEEFVKKNA